MSHIQDLEREIAAWPNVSVHSHRFGGREFRFGKAEIGHLHADGTVDIPFPRAVRDALIEHGQAEEHRWVPNSGWTTFRVRSPREANHALELLRISYLRYAVKTAENPHNLLSREAARLSAPLASVIEKLKAPSVAA